jgi:Holliday junction resolvase RusA-like endonuclease
MDQLCDDILGEDWVPLEGPLAVSTKLWTTRPKSTKLYAPKADIDNYLKAVYDSLNGRVWEDDSQVTDIFETSKRWTDSHETPGSIELIIERPIDFEQNENGTWTDICNRS